MLWELQYTCLIGAQFHFNCYQNWGTLLIRDTGGKGSFLYSKGWETQVKSLAMIAYFPGILPLIWYLKAAHP